ncbi:MAG TPA: disulfide bond formation protein DsbA [Thiomicrorhabdus sp.]|nr:disulfide bond formation protein DsbA [Thiomicrorhabdus sp.]
MKKNHIIIATVLTMVTVFALATYFYNAKQVETKNQLAAQNTSALIAEHSPKKGNPHAKVTIVEFVDPACETCKDFHPIIKDLLKKYPAKINLVIRYAPFHQGSDQMVAILEAARKQDKFWETLDLMFDTQSSWAIHHKARPDLFWNILKKSNLLDLARLQQDMNDPNIAKIIQKDLADGQTLGANKTPTFFVNGKPLPRFGYQPLMDLVNSELAAHY